MNIIGYLIAMTHMQNIEGSSGPYKDVTISVGTLDNLAHKLREENLLGMKSLSVSGFGRLKTENEDIGIYLSNNLRNYIYNKIGNPQDEGSVLTIIYKNDDTKGNVPSILISKADVDGDIKKAVDDYIRDLKHSRNVQVIT